jgi:sulfur-carrier protein
VERGAAWRDVLAQDNMIRAVNQVVVPGNCTLRDGDEVAFFPPVTGG